MTLISFTCVYNSDIIIHRDIQFSLKRYIYLVILLVKKMEGLI